MSQVQKENRTISALRVWIHEFVLQENIIKYWAGLRIHPRCMRNVYKLLKIVSHQPVKLVLSAQYIQLFGSRYPYMQLPRVPQVIGEIQVNLALNFETHHTKYFDVPPVTNSLMGTPVYTRFKGDKYFPFVFPRAKIIRGMVAQLLIAAEMEGILFPAIFLMKAALRKAFVKTKVLFLLEIEKEILLEVALKSISLI